MGDNSSPLESDKFPYVLIVTVIVLHVVVMAIIIYYSCCRKKCVCRINIQNNTIHQSSSGESIRMSTRVTQGDVIDSDHLVASNNRSASNRSSSLFAIIRTRLRGNVNATDASGDESEDPPPPYVEQGASVGHTNVGASLEELPHLPSYDDIVVQLPTLSDVQGTEGYYSDGPPTYEEVEEAKKQEL